MKLSYRGSSYDLSFGLVVPESEQTGQYRGSEVRFKQPKPDETPNAALLLRYRGARYLGVR